MYDSTEKKPTVVPHVGMHPNELQVFTRDAARKAADHVNSVLRPGSNQPQSASPPPRSES